jgi:hypothetical protein
MLSGVGCVRASLDPPYNDNDYKLGRIDSGLTDKPRRIGVS